MITIILYEAGERLAVIIDPDKPLWDQELLVEKPFSEEFSPESRQVNLTVRNIEQEAPQ